MPYRFDSSTNKVAQESSKGNLRAELPPQGGPGSSHGHLLSAPGSSHSKIPADHMDKSRQRTTLGQTLDPRDLAPFLKRTFVIIGLIVLVLTTIIYMISQQLKFTKEKAASGSEGTAETLTLPRGKKLTPAVMHQFLMKLGARAVADGNYEAAARLYGRAAEEARLAGASMSKPYIDALFAQGEVYQYNLSDSGRSTPLFEKVLKLQQVDPKTPQIKLANTYNDLADSLTSDTDINRARIAGLYTKAISLAKSAKDTKGCAYYSYNAGDFYYEEGQYDKALNMANDSLAAFGKMKDPEPVDVADSHYLAARSLAHLPGQAHAEQAEKQFDTAIGVYEKAEAEEERYANCMRDAAWNKLKLGQRAQAQELFEKAGNNADDGTTGNSSDSYMNEALK